MTKREGTLAYLLHWSPKFLMMFSFSFKFKSKEGVYIIMGTYISLSLLIPGKVEFLVDGILMEPYVSMYYTWKLFKEVKTSYTSKP